MAFENALIAVIIAGIVLFGSKRLPELFRSLGRAHAEFENAKLEAQREKFRLYNRSDE